MNDNETSLQHNGRPARHSWWESLRDDLADRFSLSEDSARQEETVDMICRGVEFRGTNLWVLIFATMIASLGLNVNSAAVIIGAMLVSPLMGPIMGVGLSLGINDFDLLKKSLRNFSLMVVVAIATSTLYFFISPLGTARSELLARTVPTTYDVLIAFFGGLAGIVAQSRKDRNSTVIPGVAIATALMPPLCTAGFGLATGQFKFFIGAFYLFFINTVFIALATYMVVRMLKYHKKKFLDPARERYVKRIMLLITLLAQEQHHGGMQEVIMSTDQAYWQVISLVNKKKLAEGYLKLLQQLDSDVEKMINEGVATKADGLSVRVKVNEAEMTLTKVEDGLSLARMLLCQLCGIDLSSPITLADENMEDIPLLTTDPHFDLSTAYENRPEIRSLELATQIYKQKVNVTRAEHLPSIALMGNYMVTNPSVFNSFENKFKGMWNVGVMVQIPIWHWGEGIYKTRAAKAEARIAQYQLQDAREKIELQVNQAAFKVKEAGKKLVMSSKNMEKAEENLRYATLGFKEGVIATSNVLEAQTAWLSAHSEKIDAQIDVKLTEIYLKKSLGTLK